MVFYYFGQDPSSWALGNDKFSLAQNLPPALQAVWDDLGQLFQDKQLAGTRIEWMTSAPDGNYAVMTKDGTLLSNCNDLLDTVRLQFQQAYHPSVRHVALSPLGGWFIRYGDGTVQVSGRFPDAFYTIASPFLSLSGTNSHQRQASLVEYVFFGANESIIVSVGTTIHYENASPGLIDVLKSMASTESLYNRLTVGVKTSLCPWSPEFFFVEAAQSFGDQSQYPFSLPDDVLSEEFLIQVASNLKPSQHLIPRTHSRGSAVQKPAHSTANQHDLPLSSNSGHASAPSTKSDPIPATVRLAYQEKFDQHSKGKPLIPGNQAVLILLESGLPILSLSKTWEFVDIDKNGQLDKEEFVQAMWLIDTQQINTPTSSRKTTAGLLCDGCARGLKFDEFVYFCTVCRGGDFDLCGDCYITEAKRCSHSMVKASIELQEVELLFAPAGYVICDGCTAQVYKDALVHWCQVCNGGDFEICEDCWKNRRVCGHLLLPRKLDGAEHSSSNYTDAPVGTGPSWSHNDSWLSQTSEMDQLSEKFGDTKLKDSLLTSIVSEKPNVKWDDVAGLETAKREVQEALIFPLRFPQMFHGKRKPRKALLLYGPPGTGKSYLAKAVATEIDHTLFSISSSDIMSKWLGESEGLMRQLFKLAREKKPSIIFIDEIDALCGKRDSGASGHEDSHRVKTEFLVQMDGLGNNNEGVFVLAATNLPWMLDPAVRRRFQKRIHTPLPERDARKRLFEIHLGDMASSIEEKEHCLDQLAKITDGHSGSDIANIVQDALMSPVRKVHTSSHFKQIRDGEGEWYTPCGFDTPGAIPMTWSQVPPKQLREPALSTHDLMEASSKVKPSAGAEEVVKCHEWTKQYGLEGA